MRISGCIITKNEEMNIATCIGSLKGIVDELIVVDTGSDDDTVRIAEDLGAFVLKQKWENDFSMAKNYALEKSKSDWIIFLDADEYFTEDTIPKVRPLIEKIHPNEGYNGIMGLMINIDKDTGQILGSNVITRIFRNRKNIRYINKVHEDIRKDGNVLTYFDARNELTIMHTGYSASVLKEKTRRNLDILLSDPDHENGLYYMATTNLLLEDHDNALKYAEEALMDDKINARDDLAYKMHAIRISSTMKIAPENKEKILKYIDEANIKYSNHPEIIAIEANYYLKEGLFEKALEKCLYALKCQEKYGTSLKQNIFEKSIHIVYYNIAYIFIKMSRKEEALEYFVQALRANKYYPEAFLGIFTLFDGVPDEDIVAFFNSLYDIRNKADMGFTSAQAARCGRQVIALYYKKKYEAL